MMNTTADKKLFLAIQENSIQRMHSSILAGADVNAFNKNGLTPLMELILTRKFHYRVDAVSMLITQGADVNKKSCDRMLSPILSAINIENIKIVVNLINSGAKLNNPYLLFKSSLRRSEAQEIAKILINNGVDINTKDEIGNTALIGRASYGDYLAVKFLLENDADYTIKNNVGQDVFDPCFIREHPEIRKLIDTHIRKKLAEAEHANLMKVANKSASKIEVEIKPLPSKVRL